MMSTPDQYPHKLPPNPLPSAPREFPEILSKSLLEPLILWGAIGLICSVILWTFGSMEEDDHLDRQLLLYQGEIAPATLVFGAAEGSYTSVEFHYQGKTFIAEAKVTPEENLQNGKAKKKEPFDILFWDEDLDLSHDTTPPKPETQNPDQKPEIKSPDILVYSKAWLQADSASKISYYLGIIALFFFLALGTYGALKRKRTLEKGIGFWAKVEEKPVFSKKKRKFYATVIYETPTGAFEVTASWKRGHKITIDKDSKCILGLVNPKDPYSFYPLSVEETEAMTSRAWLTL